MNLLIFISLLSTAICYYLNLKVKDGERYLFKKEDVLKVTMLLLAFCISAALVKEYKELLIVLGIITTPMIIYDQKYHQLPWPSSINLIGICFAIIFLLQANMLKMFIFFIIIIIVLLVVSIIIPIGFADIYSLAIIGLILYNINILLLLIWLIVVMFITIIIGIKELSKINKIKEDFTEAEALATPIKNNTKCVHLAMLPIYFLSIPIAFLLVKILF